MVKLQPLIKEANEIAKEVRRHFFFEIKLMKQLDPNTNKTSGRIILQVRVNNKEDTYQYDWSVDKFKSRLLLMREFLDDLMDDGILQSFTENNDPFWDPPYPQFLGQAVINIADFFDK